MKRVYFLFILCGLINILQAEVDLSKPIVKLRALSLDHTTNSIDNNIYIQFFAEETHQNAVLKIIASSRVMNGLDEFQTTVNLVKGALDDISVPIEMENEEVVFDLIIMRKEEAERNDFPAPIARFKARNFEDWQLVSEFGVQNSKIILWNQFLADDPVPTQNTQVYTISGKATYKHNKDLFGDTNYNAIGVPLNLYVKLKYSNVLIEIPYEGHSRVSFSGGFDMQFVFPFDINLVESFIVGFMHHRDDIELVFFNYHTYINDAGGYPIIDFESGEGIVIPAEENLNVNLAVNVHPNYAMPFRTFTLSKTLIQKVYSHGNYKNYPNHIPFTFKKVNVHDDAHDILANDKGIYIPFTRNIFLHNDNFLDSQVLEAVLEHEYGHYWHYTMCKYFPVSRKYIEGFAEFFRFISQLFSETVDPQYVTLESYESMPFLHPTVLFQTYTKFSSIYNYFLSIYDGPNSHEYGMMPTNIIGDNEDIDGGDVSDPQSMAHALFWNFQISKNFNDFNENFWGGKTQRTKASLQKLLTHETKLSQAEKKEISLNEVSKMYPVQVGGVEVVPTENNELRLIINSLDYFTQASNENKVSLLNLQGESAVKRKLSDNCPDGFYLHKKINGSWQLLTTFEYKMVLDPVYSYFDPQFGGIYKISSFNVAGEPMQDGAEFEVLPILQGDIMGKDLIQDHKNEFWYVKLLGAEIKHVNWYRKMDEPGREYKYVHSESVYIKNDNQLYKKNFYLKAEVESMDNRKRTFEKYVGVITKPLYADVFGNYVRYALEEGCWDVTIMSGTSPYKTTWGIKYEGDVFYQNIAMGEDEFYYCARGKKNYWVKCEVEDALGQIAFGVQPVLVVDGPVFPAISGLADIITPGPQYWYATYTYGGTPPYEFTWLVRWPGQSMFQIVGTGEELEYQATQGSTFELKLGVVDANNKMGEAIIQIGGDDDEDDQIPDEIVINNANAAYPNPANQVLILSDSAPMKEVKLVNLLGDEVEAPQNGLNQLQIGHLPAGLYILSGQDQLGQRIQQKIEIKH